VKKGQVRVYRSDDLREWQDMGVLAVAEKEMGYMWECPPPAGNRSGKDCDF
jgi:sucrose-6-phosphate hydrolase SacC (GH32 family)